jgi:molybdopterin molybdotransferase
MTLQHWSDIAEILAQNCSSVTRTEVVSLHGALGRILAEPLVAAIPIPAATHAVMDGFALGSKPPGHYRIVTHQVAELATDEAKAILAGQEVPTNTTCVVLNRHAELKNDRLYVSQALLKDNIRILGEEAKLGDELIKINTRLDARHLALAAAAGAQKLTVRQKPRVALLGLHDGQNIFPHASLMHALLESPALHYTDAGVTRPHLLPDMMQRLSSNQDLIIVVAESLGGETGALVSAIKGLGIKGLQVQSHIFRAALKPAKPLIFGALGEAKIIGFSGTAYATTAAAHLFLQPMLQKLMGLPVAQDFMPVQAGFSRSREKGRAEALPVTLHVESQKLRVKPSGRFGQLRALAECDGFALVSEDSASIVEDMPLLFKRLSFPLV